jgi:hypothetical protein
MSVWNDLMNILGRFWFDLTAAVSVYYTFEVRKGAELCYVNPSFSLVVVWFILARREYIIWSSIEEKWVYYYEDGE